MIPTPDLSHLTKEDLLRVYEPAEDTFLLLDALEQDADYLRERKPTICVEIGSGSGCVSAFLGRILENEPCWTDINAHALKCTEATGFRNDVIVNPVACDLVGPLQIRLQHSIDVLVFNPPYVPTEEEEVFNAQAEGTIAGAWAGGVDGMGVTNRLLSCIDTLLSDTGCFYLVVLKQNDPPGIIARMERLGLVGKVVLQRRAGRENLFILRFTRK
ncbi:S-adenosyl-L-methionine-dependent methyltransferase [Ceratobasidium sp. AG-Ba]|nr:S-adenosyl-L-methionine-dependent methyltransferase [Ceratobasidium sp. AG-Ba]